MNTQPTPERGDSHWKTTTPWTQLDEQETTCEFHGDYVSSLYQAIEPDGWDAHVAKRRGSFKLLGQDDFIKDFWSKCPKCDDEIHREQMQLYDEAISGAELRKEMRIKAAVLAGIDPRYSEADPFTMREYTPPMKPFVKWVRDYCSDMDLVIQQGRCMTFCGNPGTGKTHAMCAILNYAMRKGRSARYTTIDDFVTDIKSTYTNDSETTERDVVQAYADVDFLALDEIGRMSQTDHTMKALQGIIDRRYRKCKPTLIGTNISKRDLDIVLGQAASERLKEGGGKVAQLSWPSLRIDENIIR